MFNIELWIVAGLVAVVLKTAYQSMQKKLTSSFESIHLAQSAMLVSSIIFAAIVIYQYSGPPTLWEFLLSACSGLFLSGGLWTFNKSMETTDLSVASPLQQTIPVFATVLEPLVLSSQYNIQTILAALVTTLGAYIVVIEPENPLEPFRRITDRGPLLAVLTAFLLAINSILSYYVTQSLEVWNFILIASVSGFVVLTLLRRDVPDLRFENLSYAAVYSGNLGFSILTLSLVLPSTGTVFFRISLVLNILVGFFVFDEKNILIRISGSLVVILGVALTLTAS